MLKLKLQYFGHLMRRADTFEKTLMLGKIKGQRRSGSQRMGWLDGITDTMDMNLNKLWEIMKDKEVYSWYRYSAAHGITKNKTQFNHWNNNNKDL